jgi:hypothetical protein
MTIPMAELYLIPALVVLLPVSFAGERRVPDRIDFCVSSFDGERV